MELVRLLAPPTCRPTLQRRLAVPRTRVGWAREGGRGRGGARARVGERHGFATARHLAPAPAPAPAPSHHQRLAVLLADLDTCLLSGAPDDDEKEGIVIESLDHAHDAVRECAAAVYGHVGGSSIPSGDALRDVSLIEFQIVKDQILQIFSLSLASVALESAQGFVEELLS